MAYQTEKNKRSQSVRKAYAEGRHRRTFHPNKPTQVVLNELYFKRKLNRRQIGDFLACSRDTVSRWLKEYKIDSELPNSHLLQKWQWAYIAGIIDGEGSITLRKCKKSSWLIFSPVILFAMTDKEPIITIKQWLSKAGFHPSPISSKEKGYFYGIQLCRTKEILPMLEVIKPLLRAKRKQADVLRAFCKSRIEHFRKPYTDEETNLVQAIRKLNARKSVGGYGHRQLVSKENK